MITNYNVSGGLKNNSATKFVHSLIYKDFFCLQSRVQSIDRHCFDLIGFSREHKFDWFIFSINTANDAPKKSLFNQFLLNAVTCEMSSQKQKSSKKETCKKKETSTEILTSSQQGFSSTSQQGPSSSSHQGPSSSSQPGPSSSSQQGPFAASNGKFTSHLIIVQPAKFKIRRSFFWLSCLCKN